MGGGERAVKTKRALSPVKVQLSYRVVFFFFEERVETTKSFDD